MRVLFVACLALLGCNKPSDGLVVVTVTAGSVLQVSRLHTTVWALGKKAEFDVRGSESVFALPPARTFGIQFPSDYANGIARVAVQAIGENGEALAGEQSDVPLSPGVRADLTLILRGGFDLDGGASDAAMDGGVDGGSLVAIEPPTSLFPGVKTGVAGSSQLFTVTNNGAANATIKVEIIGGQATSFLISSDTCDGTSLAPKATCTLLAQFKPMTTGRNAADLSIGGMTASLKGEGLGTWLAETPGAPVDGGSLPDWKAVWGTASSDLYIVGGGGGVTPAPGTIAHRDNAGTWTFQTNSARALQTVWGSASNNIYAAGKTDTLYPSIVHSSGNGVWNRETTPGASDFRDAFGIWGTSGVDVYIALSGSANGHPRAVIHSTGSSTIWDNQTTNIDSTSIWGAATNVILAAGTTPTGEGTIVRSTGTGVWAPETIPPSPKLNALWGFSASDVYAVGNGGTVLHLSNGQWSKVPMTVGFDFLAIWGASPDDIWLVGLGPNILHFNGVAWEQRQLNVFNELRGIWGFSTNDIFMVGAQGTVLRYR
jgi:hypothetical protein